MFGRLFSKSKSVSSGSGDPEPIQKKVTTPFKPLQHAANHFLFFYFFIFYFFASLLDRPHDTAAVIDSDFLTPWRA
jgi:hypothetical protein